MSSIFLNLHFIITVNQGIKSEKISMVPEKFKYMGYFHLTNTNTVLQNDVGGGLYVYNAEWK